jgi:putative phosphoribosyl transferase
MVEGVREVVVESGGVALPGLLGAAEAGRGLVVFAHGSGSSRLSGRNAAVAEVLREAGFATLLFDLLTDAESADRRNVFDIDLLAERLAAATAWARRQSWMEEMSVGYFGASTGGAAALVAGARDEHISAIVSRGGRPDLAGGALDLVRAPTLLIVGGLDFGVIELNQSAFERLRCKKRLEVVEGATHLFEEPGRLEIVATLARDWFLDWMPT